LDRIGRHEAGGIDASQRNDHAHQLAAFDAAWVRAFGCLVATGMIVDRLLAVTIRHCRFGRGAAGGQGKADRGEGHCNCNEHGEEQPVHAFSCSLGPQVVNSRRRKAQTVY
jgi:hypothetical protein